jgi:hypothetical protein
MKRFKILLTGAELIKGLKTNQLSVGLRVEKEHKGKMGRDTEVPKMMLMFLKLLLLI